MTPLPATRARTTQKRVSSSSSFCAPWVISAVTTTPLPSGASAIDFTSPMSTFLYLILVLPGSRSSAVLKVMVTVGPVASQARTPSVRPINAARMGISHTA